MLEPTWSVVPREWYPAQDEQLPLRDYVCPCPPAHRPTGPNNTSSAWPPVYWTRVYVDPTPSPVNEKLLVSRKRTASELDASYLVQPTLNYYFGWDPAHVQDTPELIEGDFNPTYAATIFNLPLVHRDVPKSEQDFIVTHDLAQCLFETADARKYGCLG